MRLSFVTIAVLLAVNPRIAAGQTVATGDITVSGKVIGTNNLLIKAAKVRISNATKTIVDLAETNDQGVYDFKRSFPPGQYVLEVTADGYSDESRTIGADFKLPADFLLRTLSPQNITVSGKVIGTDNVLVKAAKVRISNAARTIVDVTETGDQGAFDFKRQFPAGAYLLEVSADGYYDETRPITEGFKAPTDFLLRERAFLVRLGDRSGVDLTLAQPGTHVFFDKGTDDPGELDLFSDGKLNPTVQLIGADYVAWSDLRQRLRLGVNTGFGLGTANEPAPTASDPEATKDSSVFMYSIAGFIDLAKIARIEGGWIIGFSAREERLDVGDGDDQAWFIGISLRTQLGNEVVKLFR